MGQLTYNAETERYELDSVELHCGDVLSVLVGTEWIDTRIELDGNDEWFLIGLTGSQIGGLVARISE